MEELNAMYMAFNETDDSTALGVTISFAGQPSSFNANLFCHGYVSPDTSCFKGQNECRMSAAILNHQVMVQQQGDGYRFSSVMGRSVGYVFNQTLVENYFGKCSYLFDGANSLNVNQGCGGTAAGGDDCENVNSAYYDMCADGGTTYHHCIATDLEIVNKKCKCEPPMCDTTYGTIEPPQQTSAETCFYEMPALMVDYENPSSFKPSTTNHLRDSMNQRVFGDQSRGDQQKEWNEVVIDERLLIPQIHFDPTHTIVAFVYVKQNDGQSAEVAQTQATSMRDQFQEKYRVNGVGDIPVIELDASTDFTLSGGPFKLPSSQSRVAV